MCCSHHRAGGEWPCRKRAISTTGIDNKFIMSCANNKNLEKQRLYSVIVLDNDDMPNEYDADMSIDMCKHRKTC